MNKKFFCVAAFVIAILIFTSCKKNDVPAQRIATQDTTPIMGFKDSTQLIKSLTVYHLDSGSNVATDSATVSFHYDTVNRRITIIPATLNNSVSWDGGDGIDSIVYQYNNDLFLAKLTYMSSIPPSDPTSEISVTYKYDADNVIQSATFTEYNGQEYTFSFNKTALQAGGYLLSWLDTSPTSLSVNPYQASFNSQGQMISNYYSLTSDSLEYDASGNLTRVIRTVYGKPYDLNAAESFTLYDFTSRDTEGDQLYNLNQVLNHGIANLTVNFGAINDILFDPEYVFQFTKYPVTSTIINRPVRNGYCFGCSVYPITSTATPVYDRQNRLVEYKLFYNEFPMSYDRFQLSYYK